MNLPVNYDESSAETTLGTASLEILRNKALEQIRKNESLSSEQRAAAVRELHFLIEHERLRRLKLIVQQWEEERNEYRYRRAIRRRQVLNQLAIEQRETARTIARINRDIIRYRLEIIEQIRKLRPKDELHQFIRRAQAEMIKLKLQRRYARARQQAIARELRDAVIRRARFLKMVREKYPDLEEELMDDYDRREFQEARSQK